MNCIPLCYMGNRFSSLLSISIFHPPQLAEGLAAALTLQPRVAASASAGLRDYLDQALARTFPRAAYIWCGDVGCLPHVTISAASESSASLLRLWLSNGAAAKSYLRY